MFDFFKDVALEMSGLDAQKVKLEKNQKKLERKKDKIIFARDVKKVIYFLAGFYILSSIGNLAINFQLGQYIYCGKVVIQVLMSVGIIVALAMHTKKSEITACVLIGLFLLLQYSGFLFQISEL